MDDKRIPERFRRALLRYETEDLPAFMNEIPEEITAARRGTLTHRFLSLIPLEPLREKLDSRGRVLTEPVYEPDAGAVLMAIRRIRPDYDVKQFVLKEE